MQIAKIINPKIVINTGIAKSDGSLKTLWQKARKNYATVKFLEIISIESE